MWSLSCRVIARAYGAKRSPMVCMQTMDNPPPNPDTPFVLAYARRAGVPPVASGLFQETPVVPVYRLERGDAFPSIELPQEVCSELEDMIKGIAS